MTQPYQDWQAQQAHEGKVPYPTRRSAKQAANRAARLQGERVSEWSAYKCIVCPSFHIGHKAVARG